jgi:hypothetical protein
MDSDGNDHFDFGTGGGDGAEPLYKINVPAKI